MYLLEIRWYMTATTLRIPLPLARLLDDAAENDPQWANRSELARSILWEWIKHQNNITVKDETLTVGVGAGE